MADEQLINPADFGRPTGGVQSTDKMIGMRGQVPFGATPGDLAAKFGIDYSLLTEQVVPGEFFIDRYGAKKQVYVQTFSLTTQPSIGTQPYVHYTNIKPGISAIISVVCGWMLQADELNPLEFSNYTPNTLTAKFISSTNGGQVFMQPVPESWVGKSVKLVITLKFIK